MRELTVPIPVAARMKLCFTSRIVEAIESGRLGRGGERSDGLSSVVWDDRLDRWQPLLDDEELATVQSRSRFASKSITQPGMTRPRLAAFLAGRSRSTGLPAHAVPLTSGNFRLLLLSQDGTHDGHPPSDEYEMEIEDLIHSGEQLYQVRSDLRPDAYRTSLQAPSEWVTLREVVEREARIGKRLDGVEVAFCGGARIYRVPTVIGEVSPHEIDEAARLMPLFY